LGEVVRISLVGFLGMDPDSHWQDAECLGSPLRG
jgi:hypothetical protein